MVYVIFWGCHLPARFAHLEYSMKKVFEALGIRYSESDRFSCCPENFGIKSLGHYPWLFTAGRNLAIAESMGGDLVSACNGCYSSLKSAWSELRVDAFARNTLNDYLSEFGLAYKDTVRVRHFLEMLYEDITPQGIGRRSRRKLHGIKVASHPGCHLLRPSQHLRFDDPFSANKFDELISATGAMAIDYSSKFLCCGGSFNYSGEEELSLQAVRSKLIELKVLGADAIITGCPTCYSQFESGQVMLNRAGEKFEIPVLYYTELLGLALGMNAQELSLDRHRISVESLLNKILQKESETETVRDIFNLEMMQQCVYCSACDDDCPAVKLSNERFQPHELFRKILAGRLEEVLASREIWQCLDCYTCEELCGQGIGMNRFFRQLREMVLAQGKAPESVQNAIIAFRGSGYVTKPSQLMRKKLGLKEKKALGEEELKKMLERVAHLKEGKR